ncbi:MAG: DUF4286 family protein [Pseudomonadota bacterium]|nr:DUF4286 family protein [Pseudomonadota bacterium]
MIGSDSDGAVVYEVNVDLDADIADAYLVWLDEHIETMCALPGFSGASVFEVIEPAADTGRQRFSVHYTLDDQAALDAYLRDHAARMRAEGESRFGGRFRASRRVLGPID